MVKRLAAGLLLLAALTGCERGEPATQGAPPALRLLSESQYRQTIADLFGPDIVVAGGFEPEVRQSGLLAVGSGALTVSPAGLEQYDAKARAIAAQALNEANRTRLLPCAPASETAASDTCARQFFAETGRLLLRRPLSERELAARVRMADAAAQASGDFYAGLQAGLAQLLVSPDFLFRRERVAADGRLDAYAKAERLSFLLWNSAPDAALLDAAGDGRLDSGAGLTAEVDRLLASPKLDRGVRAFFTDFLGFDEFRALSKDVQVYPAFTQLLVDDAQEQTLRTLADHLLGDRLLARPGSAGGDYRDLFTTRHTFMNRRLGMVYAVKVAKREGWAPYEFAADDPRAGLLTQVSFTALYAHPMRSSAVLRGKAVREVFLCQPVPAPPNNVNFAVVQDTGNPQFKTARERVTAHRSDPTCAGCHKITDPIGLALENFDGMGQFRASENGAAIDASGDLDGTRFADAAGLGRALRDNPAVPSCLVDRLYAFAQGRAPAPSEVAYVAWLKAGFAAEGHRLPALLRRIALSDGFYRVTAPDTSPSDFQEAAP